MTQPHTSKGSWPGQHASFPALLASHGLRSAIAGPDEAALKSAINETGLARHRILTGTLNENEVHRWTQQTDAFTLASFAEGIPCVTTRITGIPELIRDGIAGLLVTPSDVDELADAPVRWLEDPALRAELADNSRTRIQQKFDLNRNIDRLGQLFSARLGAP